MRRESNTMGWPLVQADSKARFLGAKPARPGARAKTAFASEGRWFHEGRRSRRCHASRCAISGAAHDCARFIRFSGRLRGCRVNRASAQPLFSGAALIDINRAEAIHDVACHGQPVIAVSLDNECEIAAPYGIGLDAISSAIPASEHPAEPSPVADFVGIRTVENEIALYRTSLVIRRVEVYVGSGESRMKKLVARILGSGKAVEGSNQGGCHCHSPWMA